MGDRPGIHAYCGDCPTCTKKRMTPGSVIATHRHPRDEQGRRKSEQKIFQSKSLAKNLRDAHTWKDKREGTFEKKALPRNIYASGDGAWLYATVPAWADPERPRRRFPADDLEEAVEWLIRATEARSAEPPLPLPPVPGRKSKPSTPASTTQSTTTPRRGRRTPPPPTMLGEVVQRWHTHYYAEAEARKEVRGKNRSKRVQKLIDTYVLQGDASDLDSTRGPEPLGTIRLDELTRQHMLNVLSRMAKDGLTSAQKEVAWVLTKSCGYAFSQRWLETDPTHGDLKAIPPTEEAIAKREGGGPKGDRPRPHIPPLMFSHVLRRVLDAHGLEVMLAGALQYYCGALRPGESLGLAMGDIDRTRHLLEITKQAGRPYDAWDADGNATKAYWVDVTKTIAGRRYTPVPELLWPYIEEQYDQRVTEGATDADAFILGNVQSSQEVVRQAFTTAFEGLLEPMGEQWAAFVPYDLRHQAVTNYQRAGVLPDVRSYIVGHEDDDDAGMNRRRRKEARGATITRTVYTHTYQSSRVDDELTEWDEELIKAGRQLNTYVTEKLDRHPLVAPPVSTDANDWMTVQEAMDLAGMGWTSLLYYFQRGLITSRTVTPPTRNRRREGHEPQERIELLRSDVDAMVAKRGSIVPMADLIALLGITRWQAVLRFAELAGVPVHKAEAEDMLGAVGYYVTTDDFHTLAEHNRERLDFLKEHGSVSDLHQEFKLSRTTITRLVNIGLVKTVEPPLGEIVGAGPAPAQWVHLDQARRAIRRYLDRRQPAA